ncbi:hypothetical protein V9U04_004891 [Salmonella enterica subsp. enterica]
MENIIKTEKCIGGSYTPGLADIGYCIKVQTTPLSDITDAASKGYTPLPASGDTWSITSSAPVMVMKRMAASGIWRDNQGTTHLMSKKLFLKL